MPTGPFCAGCPQQPIGQKCVKPDGQGTNGILIVGESPWKDELRLDRPFAGAAGHRLDRWLQLLGQQRDAFTISNAMWCAPPRLGWFQTREAQAAISHCAPHLDALIEQRKPRVILALGNTALQRLCGVSGLDEHHSYVHDSRYGVPVIPTYHPSYVMQGNQKLTGAVLFAFRRALQLAQQPFQREAVDYLLHPTIDALRDYFADWQPSMPLAFDIETAYSSKLKEDETEEDASFTIVRASCSWRERSAATFPWSEPFIAWARELLARAGTTIFWNHSFDVPRLEAAGVKFTGEIVDAMWAFHWLQSDLPKSLGFVAPLYSDLSAWKHLSDAEPERYSAMDADATLRCYYGIRRDIEAQGRWEMFERHCTRTSPLLREMGNKGLLIDLERQAAFKVRLETELAAAQTALQSLVPVELKPVHPKDGYKREPKDVSGMEQRLFGEELRWCKRLPFNPDSPKQVADLITHLKLPLPKNRKTGADSTGAKYLSRFAKKHGVFRSILDCRQRGDMLSTFLWTPGEGGRVRTFFGFHPSTWRKSSRGGSHGYVALQNFPKRAELAKEFRKMLVAAPGNTLLECVSPEAKLLHSDLTWRPAGTLQIGDELIAFNQVNGHGSLFKPSTVKNVTVLQRERVRVITDKGTTIVAENHPFVARFFGYKRRWIKAKDLMGRLGTGALMPFFGSPWETDESRDAGYLSGFFDGEGWVSRTRCGVAQNSGATLENVLTLFRARDFKPVLHKGVTTVGSNAYKYGKPNRVENWCLNSMYDTLRMLGTLRPPRLMTKQRKAWENRRTWGKRTTPAKVLRVEPVGVGDVIAIETTTGTYISDGFFSHNCDSQAIEAVLVGYAAADPDYIRLAKLGVHDFLTSHIVGEPADIAWPDDRLREHLADIKKRHKETREAAKRCIHGSNYKLSAHGMHDEYAEFFPTEGAAQKMQDFYFGLFPKIIDWQRSTLERAHKENRLDNHFSYRHWFWDVFAYDGKSREWRLGQDAKRAVAFVPQSDASAIQTEYLLILAADERIRPHLRLIIHDSIVLEVPEKQLDIACAIVHDVMTRPFGELGGLAIGAELSTGPSLGEMTVWEPPL